MVGSTGGPGPFCGGADETKATPKEDDTDGVSPLTGV